MFSKRHQIVTAIAMFLAGLVLAFAMVESQKNEPPLAPSSGAERLGPTQGPGLSLTDPPAMTSPVAFEGPDGQDVVLDDFKGRWVIVNFWATWCQPCIHEMPAFARLLTALGSDAPLFVSISIDAMGRAAAEPYAQSKGWSHVKAYADPKSDLYRTFSSPGIPLTVILNPEGREVARRLGPTNWDSELVIGQIKHLMADGKL